MPLELVKYRPWIENGFWILAFAAVYIGMQKVMHPGWTLFGL